MIDYGIILCSRFDSSRIYKKPFQYIGSKTIIEHLLDRLIKTGLNIYIAVPTEQLDFYQSSLKNYLKDKASIKIIGGHKVPLDRMRDVARYYNIKNIIRVCHDKIFVDPDIVKYAIDKYKKKGCEYLYSSEFIEGIGFEIISFNIIEEASRKYKNIEHVSYAVKALTKKQINLPMVKYYKSLCKNWIYAHTKKLRLLIDYPKDIDFIKRLFEELGEDITLKDVISYIFYPRTELLSINVLPEITVYTCVHNCDRHIKQCIKSVLDQTLIKDKCAEYIIIDDYSVDKTRDILSEYKDRVKIITNKNNLGLASSSNIALEKAIGNHIVRLDADDYFVDSNSLHEIYKHALENDLDAVYPNNYYGSRKRIQQGNKHHHVGGALFNKRAINNVKFTEGLRGHEGLDLFERAKEMLNIGYFEDGPIFFYRQRKKSMSKTNLELRNKIKENITNGIVGRDLNDICTA